MMLKQDYHELGVAVAVLTQLNIFHEVLGEERSLKVKKDIDLALGYIKRIVSKLKIDVKIPVVEMEGSNEILEPFIQLLTDLALQSDFADFFELGLEVGKVMSHIPYMKHEIGNNDSRNKILKLQSFSRIEKIKNLLINLQENKFLSDQELNSLTSALIKTKKILDDENSSTDVMQESFEDFAGQIKRILFSRRVNKLIIPTKHSEVDNSRIMDKNRFVISLVRKPKGSHSQHAFLVIEGIDYDGNNNNNNTPLSFIWFIDLATKNPFASGLQPGKIRIFHCMGSLEEKLVYRCNKNMMDIKKGDRILYKSWDISKESAYNLLKSIEEESNNPPLFNILGYSSIFSKATGSSMGRTGHNCFTWAKEKLRSLDQPVDIEDDFETWVVSLTSRFLIDKEYAPATWWQHPFSIVAFTAIGSLGAAAAVANSDSLENICKLQ